MKLLSVSLLFCLSASVIGQLPNTNNSLISPEVLPDKQVGFRIFAPEAESVTLRSDDKWDKLEFEKDSLGVREAFILHPGWT